MLYSVLNFFMDDNRFVVINCHIKHDSETNKSNHANLKKYIVGINEMGAYIILGGDMNKYVFSIGPLINCVKSTDITFIGDEMNGSLSIDFLGTNKKNR